jgi:hypothetical protein
MYGKLGNGAETRKLASKAGNYERERGDVPMWAEGHFCSIELVTFRELPEDSPAGGAYVGRAHLILYTTLPNESATIGESDRQSERKQQTGGMLR